MKKNRIIVCFVFLILLIAYAALKAEEVVYTCLQMGCPDYQKFCYRGYCYANCSDVYCQIGKGIDCTKPPDR